MYNDSLRTLGSPHLIIPPSTYRVTKFGQFRGLWTIVEVIQHIHATTYKKVHN